MRKGSAGPVPRWDSIGRPSGPRPVCFQIIDPPLDPIEQFPVSVLDSGQAFDDQPQLIAGEARLRDIVTGAGFKSLTRVAETPFNMVLEAKV